MPKYNVLPCHAYDSAPDQLDTVDGQRRPVGCGCTIPCKADENPHFLGMAEHEMASALAPGAETIAARAYRRAS